MQSYTITATPGTNRVLLAHWLHKVEQYESARMAIQAADDLLGGNDYQVDIRDDIAAAAPEFVQLVPVAYVNPYVAHFKQQEEYSALCERGAAGDVEAAITYCKLELEGKVSHGAFG